MGYPEKLLAEDEQVVSHLHPHWITLVPAAFWFVVICAAAGVGMAFLPDGSAHGPLLIAIVVVALILLAWLVLTPWITWATSHYVFTTHRVLIRRGILHHTGRDISLQRISDVAFSQTLLDRIVKAGTVIIESAGEHGQETLVNVPRSSDVQQMLNQLIEEDHARRYQRQAGAPAYPPAGYPAPGYAPGYPAGGYPAPNDPTPSYPTPSYPTPRYPSPASPPPGYRPNDQPQ